MRTRSLSIINRFTLVAILVALIGSAVQVTPVYAVSIVVNSAADNYNPNDRKCTLREAIDAANINKRSGKVAGECAAGSPTGVDTISFAGNYTITVGSGGASLPQPQLPFIISAMTITGKGAGNTIIQAAATPNTATWRVFQVTSAGNLTLNGVTVRNGSCIKSCTAVDQSAEPDSGGGIYNTGALTLINSIVSGNHSFDWGGGIYNSGTLSLTNSTVSGNSGDNGGGIYNSGTLTVTNSAISGNSGTSGAGIFNSATLTVTNSAISGNTAIYCGGGIINWFHQGTITLTNSTVSGNTANGVGGFAGGTICGGGIYSDGVLIVANSTFTANSASNPTAVSTYGGAIANAGTLTMTNATISGNTASGGAASGGGIMTRSSGTTTLKNTIVAHNTAGNCVVEDMNSVIINGGNNLDNGSTCGFGFINLSMSNTDPMLGPLAYNGGPTQTMKLLAGSPAVDTGDADTCRVSPVSGVDQRGVLRPLGAGCDIGAFETSLPPGPDTVGVFRPSNGLLYLKNVNTSGFADLGLNYGTGGDYAVVGDWDGDGDDTIGVYRNGVFLLRNSNSVGFANITVAFGAPGDQPIAGDWNNDGIDTIGVYRGSTATFLLRNSNTPGAPDLTFALGNPGDVGIAGDWNGDGTDTTGVFRPSNGMIFLKNTNTSGFANVALNYGLPGDQPVVGDWDENGTDTIGVYRNARFYLRNSNTNGFANIQLDLGNLGDMPIAGNWDGIP